MKYFIVLVIFSLSFAHAQPFSEAVEKWTMPVKVDTNAWYPYVTPDGNKLFFKGYGGYNYIEKTETGWSERTRLGNQINGYNFLRKIVLSPDEKTLYFTATQDIWIYRSFWVDSLNDWGPASLLTDNGINSGMGAWYVTGFLNDTTMILETAGEGLISYFDSSSGLWSTPVNYPVECCPIYSEWGISILPNRKKVYPAVESFDLNRGIDIFVRYLMDSTYYFRYSLNFSIIMDSLYDLGEVKGNNELYPYLTADGKTMYFMANYDSSTVYNVYESKMYIDENGDSVLTSVNENISEQIPGDFYLYPPFPNPFNSSVTVRYQIDKPAFIKIKLYDILGNEIKTIFNDEQKGGLHTHQINMDGLSSGTYLLSVHTSLGTSYKKLLLIK
jgi:hypothetical protein